jgi:hypothetical protein
VVYTFITSLIDFICSLFILTGSAGSGKTTTAAVLTQAMAELPDTCVVARLVGATQASGKGGELMSSVLRQLGTLYDIRDLDMDLERIPDELLRVMSAATSEKVCVLCLLTLLPYMRFLLLFLSHRLLSAPLFAVGRSRPSPCFHPSVCLNGVALEHPTLCHCVGHMCP